MWVQRVSSGFTNSVKFLVAKGCTNLECSKFIHLPVPGVDFAVAARDETP